MIRSDAFSSREPVSISLENAIGHDDSGPKRSKITHVIDFRILRGGMRTESRYASSSSRSG
jgi:hypothetical protein